MAYLFGWIYRNFYSHSYLETVWGFVLYLRERDYLLSTNDVLAHLQKSLTSSWLSISHLTIAVPVSVCFFRSFRQLSWNFPHKKFLVDFKSFDTLVLLSRDCFSEVLAHSLKFRNSFAYFHYDFLTLFNVLVCRFGKVMLFHMYKHRSFFSCAQNFVAVLEWGFVMFSSQQWDSWK